MLFAIILVDPTLKECDLLTLSMPFQYAPLTMAASNNGFLRCQLYVEVYI